jgi:hypothetical protein
MCSLGSIHEIDAKLIKAIRRDVFYFLQKLFDRGVQLSVDEAGDDGLAADVDVARGGFGEGADIVVRHMGTVGLVGGREWSWDSVDLPTHNT